MAERGGCRSSIKRSVQLLIRNFEVLHSRSQRDRDKGAIKSTAPIKKFPTPKISHSLCHSRTSTPTPQSSPAHIQRVIGPTSGSAISRIPTPSKPPHHDLYSHDVYRREGRRRRVLSPGKEWQKNFGNGRPVAHQRTQHAEVPTTAAKRLSHNGQEACRFQSRATTLRELEPSNPATSLNINHSSRSDSTPCSCATTRNKSRTGSPTLCQLSELSSDKTLKDYKSSGERHIVDVEAHVGFLPEPKEFPQHGKVQIEDRRNRRSTHQQPLKVSSLPHLPFGEGNHQMLSKRIRPSNGHDNLKAQATKTTTPSAQAHQAKKAARGLKSPSKARNPWWIPTNPHKRPIIPENDSPTRDPSLSMRLALNELQSDNVTQVSASKACQYWLGRFVTLTNAFHYEDSFNVPDVATGFGMLSSYSRPLGDSNPDLAAYRVKRAFMVLENDCTTAEATKSLREFRDEYIGIHGDRWMS